MTKGTIRVRDGVVVGVASEGEAIAYVHNGISRCHFENY